MTEATRLRLLGRAECGLCEEMEQALREHPAFAGLQLQQTDVDESPELQRRYGLRVPVLLDAWSEVVCEGHFDAAAFEQWRRESRRAAAG